MAPITMSDSGKRIFDTLSLAAADIIKYRTLLTENDLRDLSRQTGRIWGLIADQNRSSSDNSFDDVIWNAIKEAGLEFKQLEVVIEGETRFVWVWTISDMNESANPRTARETRIAALQDIIRPYQGL